MHALSYIFLLPCNSSLPLIAVGVRSLGLTSVLPYLSLQVSQCSIDICLKHSCVSLEILKFRKFFLMHIQNPFVFYHELQHLIFKGLSSFLPLILSSIVPILLLLVLLLLKPKLSKSPMVVLSMSRTLLCSSTIGKAFMVS